MSRKRNRLEIIRDILIVIREKNGKIKPTHILYKSNLSHQMMDEYLKELIDKGFVVEHEIVGKKNVSRTYEITEKGNTFLNKYREVIGFMEGFGLG